MYLAYTFLLGLAFIAALPYFALQAWRTGKYLPSLRERLGRLPSALRNEGGPSIWIHAVSVGEVLAARTLLGPLRAARPGVPIYLSTTTLTGHAIALKGAADLDGLFFAPLDFPWAVGQALARVNPGLLVVMETEIWPNLLHQARRRGARVAIANGRLSARSTARYRLLRPLLDHVLDDVDVMLMQGEVFAARAREIGAAPDKVRVTGSVKYDAEPGAPSEELRRLLAGAGPLVVAGSTLDGEERAVLEAFVVVRASVPGARLVIAPRHPERFALVPALVRESGLTCARRSEVRGPWATDVLVLDTLGELAGVYALARVAFVGGSLVPWGGHNVIEPAAVGVPVVVGPHMANFQDIADHFREAGALVEVSSTAELATAFTDILTSDERHRVLSERGSALVAGNRGAVHRTVDALVALIPA